MSAVLMYIDPYIACSRHHTVAMASNFVNGSIPSTIPSKYKLCSIQMFIFNDKKFNSCSFHIVSAVFVKILEKPFLGNVSYKVSHLTVNPIIASQHSIMCLLYMLYVPSCGSVSIKLIHRDNM